MRESFLIIVLLVGTIQAHSPPIVDLPLGKFEGTLSQSYSGRTYYKFLGVPYARPPTGKRRFKEPSPVQPWPGTLQANTTFKCMQYSHMTKPGDDFVIGDEDCLYLNIYTPSLDQNAKLDVIFYVHGGAFMYHFGAAQGPDYVLDKDVVYVNINYRLGPLGFLSTEDDLVPGNNGIKDQIMALQWINKYVEHFGGNPKSVTLLGCSAGGASVHFHYLTPRSRGLFHRGISQSGTALNAWVLMEQPLETAKKVSLSVGCPTNENKEMVRCLRKRSGRQIVYAVKELQPWLYNPFSPFGVVVDSWSSDPLLSDHPYNLLKRGQVADLPWIASFTNSEGLYPGFEFYDDTHLHDIDTQWNDIVPFILHYNTTVDANLRNEVSQKIRNFYMGSKPVSKSTFMDFVHILSDRLFVYDIEKAARLQASVTTSPVYSYYFTYRGKRSLFDLTYGAGNDLGASHADDTGYIFKLRADYRSTERDTQMSDIFVNMVESYAKNGKPEFGTVWLPLSRKLTDSYVFLKVASPDSFTMEVQDEMGNRTFWESLPLKENEKLLAIKDEL